MLKNIQSVFLLNLGVYLKETGIPSLLVIKKKKNQNRVHTLQKYDENWKL